ncbi:hypothetical protein C8R46DRAFT_1205604 [Mycena filopes]|nr:hypothetical protein C8R46DRAFT_1205604 [Mycena filopes]
MTNAPANPSAPFLRTKALHRVLDWARGFLPFKEILSSNPHPNDALTSDQKIQHARAEPSFVPPAAAMRDLTDMIKFYEAIRNELVLKRERAAAKHKLTLANKAAVAAASAAPLAPAVEIVETLKEKKRKKKESKEHKSAPMVVDSDSEDAQSVSDQLSFEWSFNFPPCRWTLMRRRRLSFTPAPAPTGLKFSKGKKSVEVTVLCGACDKPHAAEAACLVLSQNFTGKKITLLKDATTGDASSSTGAPSEVSPAELGRQYRKMEPKRPELVRIPYTALPRLDTFSVSYLKFLKISEKTAPSDNPRKRNRTTSSFVRNTDQEYQVPSQLLPDVAHDIIELGKAAISVADDNAGNLTVFLRREKELRNKISTCGHRITHFLALRDYFLEQAEKLVAEYQQAKSEAGGNDDVPDLVV